MSELGSSKRVALLVVVLPLLLAAAAVDGAHARRDTAHQTRRAAPSAVASTKQQPGAAAKAAPAPPRRCYDVSWTTLARSGRRYGGGVFGQLKARDGKDILTVVPAASAVPGAPLRAYALADAALAKSFKAPAGLKLAPAVSAAADFASFHEAPGGRAFVLSHFEGPQPGAVYVSELAADAATGRLRVVDTRAANASSVSGGGVWPLGWCWWWWGGHCCWAAVHSYFQLCLSTSGARARTRQRTTTR